MGDALELDPTAFEAGWSATAMERQTGGFATVEENVRAICAALGIAVTDEGIERALASRAAMYRDLFHPRAGAMETLAELKARGYPIALISMCAPDAPALGPGSPLAPFVEVEVFSSEVGLRKPDEAIYRYATDALGVEPASCLYCGDGAYGELSGAAAIGMTAYLIADPSVDPTMSLTPEREDWEGARVTEFYAGVGAVGLSLLPRVREVRMNEVGPHSLHGMALGIAALDAADCARVEVVPGIAGEAIRAASGANVVIADPRSSRRHAEIRPAGNGFLVADLDSMNGTLVNGTAIREHPLADGDEIRLGNTVLRFEAS